MVVQYLLSRTVFTCMCVALSRKIRSQTKSARLLRTSTELLLQIRLLLPLELLLSELLSSTPACAPSPVSMLPYAAEDDNSETSSLRRQSRFACNLFIQRLQRRYACNACTGVNAGLTTNSRIRVWGFATPDPRAFAPHSPLAKRNRFCEKGNALARECVQRSACNSSIGCN